ncbi:MAG TPA: hypothetical protein VFS97_15425 [Nitrososphaeraceae archaeon]|nr:hypothetical protein [Nitrososphaeraceae archaeon]
MPKLFPYNLSSIAIKRLYPYKKLIAKEPISAFRERDIVIAIHYYHRHQNPMQQGKQQKKKKKKQEYRKE